LTRRRGAWLGAHPILKVFIPGYPQHARLVANAERYYRTMFTGRMASWNLHDMHMAETLDALMAHLSRRNAPQKMVVWEMLRRPGSTMSH
jgi:Erythromycin esterase